jgi:hypothetical protein
MQFLSPAVLMAIRVTLTKIVDSKSVVKDLSPLLLDSTNINVYIKIESPYGLKNVTLAISNATRSSLKAKNSSAATESVPHTQCGLTSAPRKTLLLPTTATGGFFNSTLPPSPTGSLQVPSQINPLPFSSLSSRKSIFEASLLSLAIAVSFAICVR